MMEARLSNHLPSSLVCLQVLRSIKCVLPSAKVQQYQIYNLAALVELAMQGHCSDAKLAVIEYNRGYPRASMGFTIFARCSDSRY